MWLDIRHLALWDHWWICGFNPPAQRIGCCCRGACYTPKDYHYIKIPSLNLYDPVLALIKDNFAGVYCGTSEAARRSVARLPGAYMKKLNESSQLAS
ncbi:predicted protein [Sclerotinia sclerotiorum 1980 UF-70]|uniref:Uncharacterized protein n=1 Tax=Sclerotinia sclerotiorum (strain ATCC 18683 / 1980 / Ss-1) TaxID=665079 RepID=A7EAK3_SCLS1|nr:predicted protein [Sclerotinia sclerotiorum 1980 UF-70]EDN99481.1 predicted protein [Sclerotinia sclerotiorum 1980 UF-70]